ncbi:MAG: nucleotide exchange factor GrpE [Phycisphaerae bacterium]|nr:nucleotide exchange factor GrpE [Phycisphaerae bacterium]
MKSENIKNEQPQGEAAENTDNVESTEKAAKKGFFGKNAGAKSKEVVNLEKRIEELEQENAETFAKLQRISADYANFQKRAPKQIADSVAYEKIAIIKSLLPSIDNFEHALNGAKTADSLDSVIEGIQLVFDHMIDALKSQGVERISSLGQQFDPSLHEAMMRRAEEGKPENEIVEEFQSGYKVGDQVIRPCKVIVNKLPEAEQPQPEEPKQKETENEEQQTEE